MLNAYLLDLYELFEHIIVGSTMRLLDHYDIPTDANMDLDPEDVRQLPTLADEPIDKF